MKKYKRRRTSGSSAADEQSRTVSFDTLAHEFLEHFELPGEIKFYPLSQIKLECLIVKTEQFCRLILTSNPCSLWRHKPHQKKSGDAAKKIKGGYHEVSAKHCTIFDIGAQRDIRVCGLRCGRIRHQIQPRHQY
jgi:hypothetical protein